MSKLSNFSIKQLSILETCVREKIKSVQTNVNREATRKRINKDLHGVLARIQQEEMNMTIALEKEYGERK